jgi:hypothetical protein
MIRRAAYSCILGLKTYQAKPAHYALSESVASSLTISGTGILPFEDGRITLRCEFKDFWFLFSLTNETPQIL